MASQQQQLTLSTLVPELRAAIFDRVFNDDDLIFEGPCYVLSRKTWSIELLRVSKQMRAEGRVALHHAFRRATIVYRSCLPPHPEQLRDDDIGEDVLRHCDFIRRYGKMFESLEIVNFPFGPVYLTDFPNLKNVTLGPCSHSIWSDRGPLRSTPSFKSQAFKDLPDEELLSAWDGVCQRLRRNRNRLQIEESVLGFVDGREGDERGFRLYIRLVLEAYTSGVSDRADYHDSEATDHGTQNALISVDERKVVERTSARAA